MSSRATFIIAPLMLAGLAATVQVTENRSLRSTLHPSEHLSDLRNSSQLSPPLPSRTEDTDTIDLYGNEVTDAIAKYKLDATGALYETHSPQTEVPRLAAPKS